MGTCCSAEKPAGHTQTESVFYDSETPEPRGEKKGPLNRSPPVKFTVTVHSAELTRSFAKVGNMDPYAIVRSMQFVNGDFVEVLKTDQHKGAHKTPKWDASTTLEDVPESVQIEVWDKNRFHKNVFCGSVIVPITSDMGYIDEQDYELEKKKKPTGTVCLTLQIGDEKPLDMARVKTTVTVGGEVDGMIADLGVKRDKSKRKTTLKLQHNEVVGADEEEEGEDNEPSGVQMIRLVSRPASTFPANALMGSWTCVATQGLDEFLVASGAGMFQRKIAKAAKWPAWDFAADGDNIVFVNHSAIGDLREDIPLGKEYEWIDGKSNKWSCDATWTASSNGGTLLISRRGTPGDYTEERVVTGDKLEFILKNPKCGVSWGRSFTRDA